MTSATSSENPREFPEIVEFLEKGGRQYSPNPNQTNTPYTVAPPAENTKCTAFLPKAKNGSGAAGAAKLVFRARNLAKLTASITPTTEMFKLMSVKDKHSGNAWRSGGEI